MYKILNQASKDVFIPVTAGGGIRNEKDIREVLKSGADKIMVNSSILANPTLINQFVNIFGSSTICANIEAKKIIMIIIVIIILEEKIQAKSFRLGK